MPKGQINLQDNFLNQLRKEGQPVTLFLINGFQLRGTIKGFDNFTVVVEGEGKQQMVYKHAISTIVPAKAVNLMPDGVDTAFDKNI
ncbi:MAG: RNA chaperone Hfq [Clostridia bacterium]|nr:RNA chaperone Hfq [Clostridia bacterium]